jgi:hypothetical protein
MTDTRSSYCPECDSDVVASRERETLAARDFGRRDFLRAVGAGAAGFLAASSMPGWRGSAGRLLAEETPAATAAAKPAEALIRELFATLTDEQKTALVLPWDHGVSEKDSTPTRLQTFNSAVSGTRIGDKYTKPQQELVRRTLRAILSSDEAYERITRYGKWDSSGGFEGNGAVIFGDPSGDKPFSWMFAGHHLTVRCDGNSQPGAAFGGPMYYGHSAPGESKQNVYNYQTQQVKAVFEALTEKQREKAILPNGGSDGRAALAFRPEAERKGIAYVDLNGDQRKLVDHVLRTLIDPFRKEDSDEVMELVKKNGGTEKIQLAFYKDMAAGGDDKWHSWRLEGPGFVWNYRVLPHVHCFVNIVSKA